jgi:SSS family solute:Na+ symporter
VGVGLPLFLLLAYELWARSRDKTAQEFLTYQVSREQKRIDNLIEATPEEALEIKRQNKFGLQVIAGALLFTSVILFVLSTFTTSGAGITAIIAGVILVATLIPYSASRKIKIELNTEQLQEIINSDHR